MFTSLIGLICAILLVIYGIMGSEGGALIYFFDLPSIALVVGTTTAVLVMSHPLSVLKTVPKLIKFAYFPRKLDPQDYINQMVEYSKIARSQSLLALEESAKNAEDPFVKSSLMLIVDANDSDRVKEMLDSAIEYMQERHERGMDFFDRGSALSPAMGMLGTIMGLINMLMNLEGNSAGLGAGMAFALITTFYGSILGNIVFKPISNKLQSANETEVLCMEIVKSGALAILSGANPRYIEEKLNFMLPDKDKKKNK